jgi:hypothetical protein
MISGFVQGSTLVNRWNSDLVDGRNVIFVPRWSIEIDRRELVVFGVGVVWCRLTHDGRLNDISILAFQNHSTTTSVVIGNMVLSSRFIIERCEAIFFDGGRNFVVGRECSRCGTNRGYRWVRDEGLAMEKSSSDSTFGRGGDSTEVSAVVPMGAILAGEVAR